jgi:mono/diheme cytochrome c family protein
MKHPSTLEVLLLLLLNSCGGNKTPEKTNPVIPEKQELADGITVYNKYCLACHQTNGSGVPGMYPPVTKSDWVEGDSERLIGIILNGLRGEIKVNGQVYKTDMPAHQYLSDEQISAVLSYIRTNFGNTADGITPAEVTAVRNMSPDKQ